VQLNDEITIHVLDKDMMSVDTVGSLTTSVEQILGNLSGQEYWIYLHFEKEFAGKLKLAASWTPGFYSG
jgi:hypothetical protein